MILESIIKGIEINAEKDMMKMRSHTYKLKSYNINILTK